MTKGIGELEDEAIQGIADLVESRPDENPEALAAALLERAGSVDVGNPTSRSFNRFVSIVDRIRGRTMVEDLGLHQFTVDWFAFHVPPGAKGRLKVTHKQKGTRGVSLKVLGLGFGAGRSLSIAVEDDYGERTECLRLRRTFEAHFRAFEDRPGRPYFQVDVQKVVKDSQSGTGDCDLCGTGALPITDFAPIADVAIDLTNDPKGRTLSDLTTIEENRELELSLPIKFPGFDIKPGVILKRSVELACSYGYVLPGGYCYTPYRAADGWKDFPFWLRT